MTGRPNLPPFARPRTVELSQAEKLVDAGLSIANVVPGAGVLVDGVRFVGNLVDDDDGTDYERRRKLEHAHAWRYAERLERFDVLLVCECGELLRRTIPAAEPES